MITPIHPSASDRIVDAWTAARSEIEEQFPHLCGPERERSDPFQRALHKNLCAAVEQAYADGFIKARRTAGKRHTELQRKAV